MNIKQIRVKLERKLIKVQKECVKNAYEPEKEKWNQDHFKY